jgi:hypothetical protein
MSRKRVKTGGGAFDPNAYPVYFIASSTGRLTLGAPLHSHLLIAVNEIESERDTEQMKQWINTGKRVFLDSGVYHLATTHAKRHNLSMDVALGTAPGEVDGFEALFEKYVQLVKSFESQLWGYIEIDQGGRENKIGTRERLEALGLRPIPVYHPLNDGWDYFDELAERYDRICFGNIVQANPQTRKRLLATMWERHRKYPHLWIHILGLTPNPFMNAYPSNSADSSSWLAGLRWADAFRERTMCASIGSFPRQFRYEYGANASAPNGANKAVELAAYWSTMIERNWSNHIAAMNDLNLEVYYGV